MSSTTATSTIAPPPPCLEHGDQLVVDVANSHLSSKRSFLNILRRSHRKAVNGRHHRTTSSLGNSPPPSPADELFASYIGSESDYVPPELVRIDDEPRNFDQLLDKDVYQWAILYENQRGVTLFSTPYYSPMSLLPMDPPPFTVPSASASLLQPTVSLSEYPLPDGTWRWVSREWMIDMRGDSQVQYDGFEYSWSFRSSKWRPTVGALSTGGFVRRRRWVRLMMRPAKALAWETTNGIGSASRAEEVLEIHYEQGVTRPPSVVAPVEDEEDEDIQEMWRGDEGDWVRCHASLKRLGCDGRKLELWKLWLGYDQDPEWAKKTRRHEHLTPSEALRDDSVATDVNTDTREAPREHVRAVIRLHGPALFGQFVYPESRVQFLEILRHTGFLSDFEASMPPDARDSDLWDFWSYMDRMHNKQHD